MTHCAWRAAMAADDLADAPFTDDAERIESEWLLARTTDTNAPAPSSEIANDYTDLEDLLDNMPLGPPDDSWHAEVLRIARTASPSPVWRRRAVRWAAGVGFAAAAAVALFLFLRPPAEVEIAIRHGEATRRDSAGVVVGDHLVVTARLSGSGDLRVFRADGTLVARCPDGPGCGPPTHGEYAIEVNLDAPIRYQVILVDGMPGAPLDRAMSAYLDAAHAANARVVTYEPIDVH